MTNNQSNEPSTIICFCDLSALWLDIIRRQRAVTTFAKYQQVLNCYLLPTFGSLPVMDIDTLLLSDFFAGLQKPPHSLSRQTVHLIKTVCQEIFYLADALALVPFNPCVGVYVPKRCYDPSDILSTEAIRALLQKKHPGIYENLFPLMLVSAMRFGEAAALSVQDIDTSHNTIRIRKQLVTYYQDGHLRQELHPATKNHSCRTISLPSFAMQYLENERIKRDEKQRFAYAQWTNPDDIIFTNATGGYLSHCHVYRKFKKLAAELDQPNATLHTLRHTGATFAYFSWHDLQKVRSLTGHTTEAAAAYYIHSIERLSQGEQSIWII